MKRIIFWNKEKEKYMSRVSVILAVPGGSGSGESEKGGDAGDSEGGRGSWEIQSEASSITKDENT